MNEYRREEIRGLALVGRMVAREGKRDELLQLLEEATAVCGEHEPAGALSVTFHVSPANPDLVVLVEHYPSRASFDEHRANHERIPVYGELRARADALLAAPIEIVEAVKPVVRFARESALAIDETRALWEKFKIADQAHDAEAISQLYAEDVGGPGFPFRGREALRKFDSTFYAAFPDYEREFLKEVIDSDTVAAVWHYTATHTGRWMGMEPTGLKLDVRGCSVFTFRDGHIAEVEMFGPGIMGELVREANLQLVRRFYAAENARDLDTCAACLAPDVEVWGNGRLIRSGREAQIEHTRENYTAFPDWQLETLSLLADGDTVVARWRGGGTHLAPYAGIPATGKRIEIFGTTSFEIRAGQIKFYRFDLDPSPLLALAGG